MMVHEIGVLRTMSSATVVLLVGCGSTTSAPAPATTTTTTTTVVETRSERESRGPAEPGPPVAPALEADARALLDAHNRYRASHCAPPLAWSVALARTAQVWADGLRERGCALEHSQAGLGENLAGGTAGTLPADVVVALWYRESAEYSFRRPGFSMQTGHFTQLVWRSTTELGCGRATCSGLDLWVCNYDPPGNVEDAYERNVLPTSCH